MSDILYLHDLIAELKSLKRKGWEVREISNPESVADHSYAVSVLTMVMSEKLKLDTEKCIKLALIHDLVEAKTGDITPREEEYSKKEELEKKAITKIVEKTGYGFIEDLFCEYQENKTEEAKLVHDMDKIDMILQARNYKKKFPEKNLEEFFEYVKDKLNYKESTEIFEKIIKNK